MSSTVRSDKVWMYEEIMTNDDNLESNLLTSSLLKICSLYKLSQRFQVVVCDWRATDIYMNRVKLIIQWE